MQMRAVVRSSALAAAVLSVLASSPPVVTAQEAAVDQVFVSVPSDGDVKVIDRLTMQPAGAFAGGGAPGALAVTPDGERLLVVDADQVRLQVFDIATRSLLANPMLMSGDAELVDVVVSPDGETAYVSAYQPARLILVDLDTYEEGDRISVPFVGVYPGGRGVAITPDGTKVFFVDRSSLRLHMFDTAARAFVGTGAEIPAGAEEVGVSADGTRGIVVGENEPVFFSTATGEVTSSEQDVGRQLDVAVVGNRAYVTNAASGVTPLKIAGPSPRSSPVLGQAAIDVYDLAAGTHVESHALPEGTWPQGLAVRDAEHAYPCMEDDGTGHLLAFDAESGTAGATADTGGVPYRAVLYRTDDGPPPPDETEVVSFFLPRSVYFGGKLPGRHIFTTGGIFDDGGLDVDWSEPVRLTVGDYEREFTFVPNRKGTVWKYRAERIAVHVVPHVRGSSKGRFRLRLQKEDLDGLVPRDGPVRVRFQATGLPDMAGTVKLEKGRYRMGGKRGALVEPVMFTSFGRFALGKKGDGTDAAILRCGLATNGITPASLDQVQVGAAGWSLKIPGTDFVKSGDSFRATVRDGTTKVVVLISFRREWVKVFAKNVELGPLVSGQVIDVVLDPGTGVGVCRNTVRLGTRGKRLSY